jgi:hypothetical protein
VAHMLTAVYDKVLLLLLLLKSKLWPLLQAT